MEAFDPTSDLRSSSAGSRWLEEPIFHSRRRNADQSATMVDEGRRPKVSVDVLRAELAEAMLEARELGEENVQLRDELAEALAKVHDLGAKYGSDMSDSVVRKAKAHAADQRDHLKRLEKEVHMINSKGRMLEVQCDMLQQQEEQLRNSFDRILTWLGLLGAAVVFVFAVGAVWPASWAPFVGALGWKCDASCEPKIEIIKSCPA